MEGMVDIPNGPGGSSYSENSKLREKVLLLIILRSSAKEGRLCPRGW
jgi:hypothetical protein